MSKIMIDDTNILSLENQLERIALEKFFANNIVDLFSNVMPGLAAKLTDATDRFKGNFLDTKEVKVLKNDYKDISILIPHATYSNYSNTLVSVPEGFEGILLEYIKFISGAHDSLFIYTNDLISQYNFILSGFITNKEAKISLTDHNSLFLHAKKNRELLSKNIATYFSLKHDLSKTKLSSIIERFSDLSIIVNETIKLQVKMNNENIRMIADGVKKSIDLLNVIKKQLDDGLLTNLSGNAVHNIAGGAYELASYVEFISVYRYKEEQAITCVQNTLLTLKEIMK